MGRSRSTPGLFLLAAAGLAAVLSSGGAGCGWGFAGVGGSTRRSDVGRSAAKKRKSTVAAPVGPPVEPKRPKNGYMLWLDDNRARIAKAGGSVAEVAKQAGQEWGSLKPAAKAKYEKQAATVKAAYEKELQAFEAAGGVRKPRRSKKDKEVTKVKDPNKPKRPLTAYMLWLKDNRQKIVNSLPADHQPTDVLKEAGKLWAKVTKKVKGPYETAYQKDKGRYEKEMEQYQPA